MKLFVVILAITHFGASIAEDFIDNCVDALSSIDSTDVFYWMCDDDLSFTVSAGPITQAAYTSAAPSHFVVTIDATTTVTDDSECLVGSTTGALTCTEIKLYVGAAATTPLAGSPIKYDTTYYAGLSVFECDDYFFAFPVEVDDTVGDFDDAAAALNALIAAPTKAPVADQTVDLYHDFDGITADSKAYAYKHATSTGAATAYIFFPENPVKISTTALTNLNTGTSGTDPVDPTTYGPTCANAYMVKKMSDEGEGEDEECFSANLAPHLILAALMPFIRALFNMM